MRGKTVARRSALELGDSWPPHLLAGHLRLLRVDHDGRDRRASVTDGVDFLAQREPVRAAVAAVVLPNTVILNV